MGQVGDYQGLCAEYEEDIEEKNKEIERLKKQLEDALEEIRNLNIIQTLNKKALGDIEHKAIDTPDDNNVDRLNEAINDIMAIAKQALKGE